MTHRHTTHAPGSGMTRLKRGLALGAAAAVVAAVTMPAAAVADDDWLTDGTPITLADSGDTMTVEDVALSGDGSRAYVATAGDLNIPPALLTVDLASGNVIDSDPIEDAGFSTSAAIEASPDGKHVYLLDVDGILTVFDATDDGLAKASTHDLTEITPLAFDWSDMTIAPDGATMYIPMSAATIDDLMVLDLTTFQRDNSFPTYSGGAYHSAITPDGSTLVLSTDDGIRIIDLSDPSHVVSNDLEGDTLAVSADSASVYVLKTDVFDDEGGDTISKVSLIDGSVSATHVFPLSDEGVTAAYEVDSIAASPDGRYVYAGSVDGDGDLAELFMLSADDLTTLATRGGLIGSVDAVNVAGDGTVYTATGDAYFDDASGAYLYPFTPVVTGAPVDVSISVSPESGAVVVGQQVTLQAVPSNGQAPYTYAWTGPGGFTSDEATVTLEKAQPSAVGTYQVVVTDKNGENSSAKVKISVDKAATTTTASVDASSVERDAEVTLGAQVSVVKPGDATLGGAVTFAVTDPNGTVTTLDPVELTGDTATATFEKTATAGDYTVTATYAATSVTRASHGSTSFTVTPPPAPAAPTITNIADGDSFVEGSTPATLSGTGIDGAKVHVTSNGDDAGTATVANGSWTISLPDALPAGSYEFVVTQTVDGVDSAPATVTFTVTEKQTPTPGPTPDPTPTTGPTPNPTPTTGPTPNPTPTTGPTPNPTPTTGPTDTIPGTTPSDSDLAASLKGGIDVPAQASPGDSIPVTTDGVAAGTTVGVWMFSTGIYLGTHVVSDSGTVIATIPADAPLGAHEVGMWAENGSQVGWDSISLVDAASTPGGDGNDNGDSGSAATGSDNGGNGASDTGSESIAGGELVATGGDMRPLFGATAAVLILAALGTGIFLFRRRSAE